MPHRRVFRSSGNGRLTDAQWARIAPLLPPAPAHPHGGRPREDDRKIMDAILHVFVTGRPWNSLPREYGHSSTTHERYLEWRDADVFGRLLAHDLLRPSGDVRARVCANRVRARSNLARPARASRP
ncbi:MAG: transposase [Thermoplasmatota archaeon]